MSANFRSCLAGSRSSLTTSRSPLTGSRSPLTGFRAVCKLPKPSYNFPERSYNLPERSAGNFGNDFWFVQKSFHFPKLLADTFLCKWKEPKMAIQLMAVNVLRGCCSPPYFKVDDVWETSGQDVLMLSAVWMGVVKMTGFSLNIIFS